MWVCFSVSPVSDGGGFVFNFDDNGGDTVENVCKAVRGAFGGRDVENINRNEKSPASAIFRGNSMPYRKSLYLCGN